jgi:glyoxylase-like metal-dependent hydrolase (beta-lactamase superfamily II)
MEGGLLIDGRYNLTMEVRTLRAPNPGPLTLGGTNTYLVGNTVVDPGPDHYRHLERVLAAGTVERIVLTHRHPDHAAGAGCLSELSGAPILAFGEGLQDSGRISDLVAIHTPGHAPDHLCFWHPESRILFSGDLIAGTGSIMVAPPEGDLEAYAASLRRVRALAPARILPGHGPEVSDAVTKIDDYLAHRREREERVVAALESGAASLEEVVDLAYAEVSAAMRPYARLSARAHLEKLGHRTLST